MTRTPQIVRLRVVCENVCCAVDRPIGETFSILFVVQTAQKLVRIFWEIHILPDSAKNEYSGGVYRHK